MDMKTETVINYSINMIEGNQLSVIDLLRNIMRMGDMNKSTAENYCKFVLMPVAIRDSKKEFLTKFMNYNKVPSENLTLEERIVYYQLLN